jgi:hypothetical protein
MPLMALISRRKWVQAVAFGTATLARLRAQNASRAESSCSFQRNT